MLPDGEDTLSSLKGKRCFVTGGARGIGFACAQAFVARGASVVIADLGDCTDAVERLGVRATSVQVDVSDPESVSVAVGETVTRLGGIDVAVNNAGVGMPIPFPLAETSDAEWRRVTSINLDGVFYAMRAELNVMTAQGSGSIINMGSVGSVVALPSAAPYVAAKHALVGLTKTAAVDYADKGIRVNAVLPGYIETAISSRTPARLADLTSKHPVGRLGQPEEVAGIVCLLASDDASFMTGGVYAVDGGYSAI